MTVRPFSAVQYVALGLDGPWVGPFALENRRARDDRGGDGHYYLNRGHTILGIVLHITAGITGIPGSDRSAENTTQYGRTTTTAASWTTISDSDSCINSLHPLRVAFVQGVPGYNFNRPLWGHEIGKADADWAKMNQVWVDATLYHAAVMLAPVVIKYGIPLVLITDRDEVQRRINRGQLVGFTYHWRLTPGTRSDPGLAAGRETFPIERFFHFLRIAIAQLQGKPVPAPPAQPDPSVKVEAGTVLEVTAEALNCRSGPGAQHEIVGTAPKGTLVTATGRTSGAWMEAATAYQAQNRIVAWWHSGYLRVTTQPAEAVKAVQLRLLDLGYDLGPAGADGAPGALTTAAVTAYSTDHDYPGSRTAWAALLTHLEDTIMSIKTDLAAILTRLDQGVKLPRAEHRAIAQATLGYKNLDAAGNTDVFGFLVGAHRRALEAATHAAAAEAALTALAEQTGGVDVEAVKDAARAGAQDALAALDFEVTAVTATGKED